MRTLEKNIAVVMLHGLCDMACTFCVTENSMECMTLTDYKRTLDRLRESGFDNIVIGGGEPFCWPHGLYHAAALAKKKGFLVQVGTNGIKLDTDSPLPDYIDRFVLPLDGVTAEEHNRVRLYPQAPGGHFQIILDRLHELKKAECSVTVSTVVTRHTLETLGGIGDFLENYVRTGGILHAWHLYCFIPEGRGGRQSARELGITSEEFEGAVAEVRQRNYPFTIFKRPNMRHSAHVDFFWRQDGQIICGSEYWTQVDSLSRSSTL